MLKDHIWAKFEPLLSRLLEPILKDWFVDPLGHLGFQKSLDAFQVSMLPVVWGFQSHLGGPVQNKIICLNFNLEFIPGNVQM